MVDDRVVAQDSAKHAALFEARVGELFERLPMLCGFYVSDDLEVLQIAVHSWPGWVPGRELTEQIRAALEDLIVEGAEETIGLLRGRTIARALH